MHWMCPLRGLLSLDLSPSGGNYEKTIIEESLKRLMSLDLSRSGSHQPASPKKGRGNRLSAAPIAPSPCLSLQGRGKNVSAAPIAPSPCLSLQGRGDKESPLAIIHCWGLSQAGWPEEPWPASIRWLESGRPGPIL
jgi:hypothetical protein